MEQQPSDATHRAQQRKKAARKRWNIIQLVIWACPAIYFALQAARASSLISLTRKMDGQELSEEERRILIAFIDSMEEDYTSGFWLTSDFDYNTVFFFGALGLGALGGLTAILMGLVQARNTLDQLQHTFARPFLGVLLAIPLWWLLPFFMSHHMTLIMCLLGGCFAESTFNFLREFYLARLPKANSKG